jgi:hypothetical protein
LCRLLPCCPLPSSVVPSVVMPPVTVVVPPGAVVVPPVTLLPLAVVRRAVRCHAARRRRRAARRRCLAACRPAAPCPCRPSPSSCRIVLPPVAFCVPWRPIGGIGPYQGTVASPMIYTWSKCPWMCQTGADSVNTTTSMTMMSSSWKYHGCARLWMEVPYPTGAKY